MEKAFRTEVSSILEVCSHIKEDEIKSLSNRQTRFKKDIRPFIYPADGIINGDTLKNTYFPTSLCGKGYDVFISHSHNDKDTAVALAAWLEFHCGLTCFVDSFAWGSADQLLREIDNKYCYRKHNKTYDYTKRNFTTSHVHAILSMALLDCIAGSRFCIFIESQESISMTNGLRKKTFSPWLYEEINFMKLFQPKEKVKLFEATEQKIQDFKMAFDVDVLRTFPKLGTGHLMSLARGHDLEEL